MRTLSEHKTTGGFAPEIVHKFCDIRHGEARKKENIRLLLVNLFKYWRGI